MYYETRVFGLERNFDICFQNFRKVNCFIKKLVIICNFFSVVIENFNLLICILITNSINSIFKTIN